jgi:hypothetical protein
MRKIRALPIARAALLTFALACSKKLTADAIETSPDAVAQKGSLGASTWVVGPDGTVNAALKGPDGKPITRTVTGQVTFQQPRGASTSVPVTYDPQTGVLTAKGPTLDADITPVTYALTVDGKPWNGTIDVPPGGTHELVASAPPPPPGAPPPPAPGPNGGVVQTVGPDRVEVLANKNTGEVRAYVLGEDNQPIDPGDRAITVALEGEAPEVVVLEPEPGGHFVVGHMRAHVDPERVTIAVRRHGRVHACLVGWSPGAVVVVGPGAPRIPFFAVEAWPGDVEWRGRHHHGEVVVGGPELVVGAPPLPAPPGVVVGVHGSLPGPPGLPPLPAPPGLPSPRGLPAPGLPAPPVPHASGFSGGQVSVHGSVRGGGGRHGR